MNKIQELARETGRSQVIIYRLVKRLGRIPTIEEIVNRKAGRPRKYNY